jgi:signal peptidase I
MESLMQMLKILFLRHQAKKLFFQSLKLAKKQQALFSIEKKAMIKQRLESFQDLFLNFPLKLTKLEIHEFKKFKKQELDLKGLKKFNHAVFTTALALIAALLIRQMWFELYKVPTGSMRPTIKELDHLTVSKLNFSLNVPFQPKHFIFDKDKVLRSSVCVFTSENMDISDSDTMYFYIIPGKKLLVKRLIAKPEDTIYFYGGKVFGIDKDGKDISNEINLESISKVDYVPFIQWYGEKDSQNGDIFHMNAPFARFFINDKNKPSFDFSIPQDLKNEQTNFENDLSKPWGIENYGMTRLLNNTNKKKLYPFDLSYSSKGLYLEIKHHLNGSKLSVQTNKLGKVEVLADLETSIMPLSDEMAKKLFSNLYTARFIVKDGFLKRYGSSIPFGSNLLPRLQHIPDGTYEFYYGDAYQIHLGGYAKKLNQDHPIYRFSSTALEIFFNLGIEFNQYFSPSSYDAWTPARYSYYRSNDLYVMGMPFLTKDEAPLKTFIEQENEKLKKDPIYKPFIDTQAPYLANGDLDVERIKTLGLKIPKNMYLMLGDNHAQSGDSRVFGFVPEENLKGSPDIIFFPPGPRFGHLPQAQGELVTLPRAIIWSIAWIGLVGYYRHKKKKETLPQALDFL